METQSVLSKYKRQPKIYISLPSGGKWYSKNPMEKSGSGELPIYSMTARDELAIKTPDALMNGESTATVIASCCPLLGDPWNMPTVDLDALLIAIRIATYGEKMEIEVPITVPGSKQLESETFEVDLREVLDGLQGKEWPDTLQHGDLTFHLRPLTYKQTSSLGTATYESQRLATILSKDNVNEDDKIEAFKQGLKKLSQINMDTICMHVVAIDTPEGSETDTNAIRDFFDNTDKDTFMAIQKHLEQIRNDWSIPPKRFKVPDEYVEKGASETVEVPMLFDQSNFFVSR